MTKGDMTFYLGILFLVLGCAVVLYVKYLQRKAKQSLSWPSVEGEIVHSEVVQKSSGGGVYSTSTTFRADVQYRYQVRARSYRGDKVCVGIDIGTGSQDRAEERCARYQVNSPVTVYYNPGDPQEACLERILDAPYFLYILAGAWIFFGLVMTTGLWWRINSFIRSLKF